MTEKKLSTLKASNCVVAVDLPEKKTVQAQITSRSPGASMWWATPLEPVDPKLLYQGSLLIKEQDPGKWWASSDPGPAVQGWLCAKFKFPLADPEYRKWRAW